MIFSVHFLFTMMCFISSIMIVDINSYYYIKVKISINKRMKEQQLQPTQNQGVQIKKPLLQQGGESNINKTSKRTIKSLQKYRKKLLAQVVTIFLICLIVILERVFYQIIAGAEEKTLAEFQLSTDLVRQNEFGQIYAHGITNGFLKFFGSLSQFPIQFLFLTHFLATLYVSFDALLTTKILYITMAAVYFVSVIQMFYAGARPYWTTDRIFASSCLQSYNHPSMGLILMTFVPCYAYYAWTKKNNLKIGTKTPLKHLIIAIGITVLIIVTQFLNYMIGTMYLINIGMSLVISTLLLMIFVAANSVIEEALKKSTILRTDAKKYVFYWLLFICLLGTFVLVVFSGEDLFLDIDWVDNFMACARYQSYPDKSYRYDEIIGPWFNFTQTSILFGWIGAVFGISEAFRKIPNIEWAKGSLKHRLLRGLVANILIIPSWFFILLAQDAGTWIKDIGLNAFIVNAIHFFLLYIWIFGYMPILLLQKLLNWTNKQDQDFYVIIEKSELK